MSTLSALRDWLLADTAIAAIVDDRVLVQVAPTGYASPYIRITPVSTLPEQCHDTALDEAEDGVRAQLDIYADTLADADELQPLVRARALLIGTIPVCDYTEPHDQTTGRWRRTIDLIFSPNDLEG